jgi:hypothetical protein
MTDWTEIANRQIARQKAGWKEPEEIDDIPDDKPENWLQKKCEDWLNARGYPYIHDRSRKRNRKGQILDLHIYLPEGRHVVIELKVKGNKMSDEQRETYRKILYLGHEIHEVRSYNRFLKIMEKKTP